MSVFRQCDLERAVRGCRGAGLSVEAVEITVDGGIRVLTHRPAPGVAVNDDCSWVDLAGAEKDQGRAGGA